MSDGLQLAVFSEVEETIDTCTHRDASGVVMGRSEMSESLALDFFDHSGLRVIFLLDLSEIPVHSVLDTRCDVYVLEGCEVRKTDLEGVGHTVLELVPESRLVELGCLEVDPVLECSVVTE